MKKLNFFLMLACFFFMAAVSAQDKQMPSKSSESGKWVLVIHGGAGGPPKGTLSPEKEKLYLESLREVLDSGSRLLGSGRSALDVVEICVRMMEDNPLFNAGKGSVFTAEGKNEMDASVMDGLTMKAGAVAGVTIIRNPVTAARAVMEKSPHVLLAGEGAENFAKKQGVEIADPSYFYTKERWDALQNAKAKEKNDGHGTVGAVALDANGNLAAATSTGGMTNKMKGRVGDSPVIGAGTYASNRTCAVSATGHGEFFIRNVVAYDVSALMEYKGMKLQDAADLVINKKLKDQKAEGGLIAVDREGNIAMPFNSNAMFRGMVKAGAAPEALIY